MNLQTKYQKIVQKYINEFCKKHDTYLEFWVGSDVGHIAVIGDHFMSFKDIRHDIDTNQPSDNIWDYHDFILQHTDEFVHYDVWCKNRAMEKTKYVIPNLLSGFLQTNI